MDYPHAHGLCGTSRRRQRGLAALEFVLAALFIMIPTMLGTFVFWEVLQTQQVVTRATGDGARQAHRILQKAKLPKSNGSVPSDAEVKSTTEALIRQSIAASLRSHLSNDPGVEQRLTVTLQSAEAGQLALDVAYARPALLGSAGGLNFIEPPTLNARSLIHWP